MTLHRERMPLVAAGAVALGLAVVGGQYLAAEAWSAGALGFPLLLALPGLWMVLRAFGAETARLVAGAAALAVMLLGLDVVDSARREVVVAGWLIAATSAAVVLALLGIRQAGAARRERPYSPCGSGSAASEGGGSRGRRGSRTPAPPVPSSSGWSIAQKISPTTREGTKGSMSTLHSSDALMDEA